MEFLHSFGKVLGFDLTKDVPSLGVLQEGLLCQGDSLGKVQDLLVRLLKAALHDPGLPSHCQVSFTPPPHPEQWGCGSFLFLVVCAVFFAVLHLFFSLSLFVVFYCSLSPFSSNYFP